MQNRYHVLDDETKTQQQPPQQTEFQPPYSRHRTAGVILSDPEGRYAVVRGRESGRWSFPKGHAKRGETMEETALREMREEIGARPLPPTASSKVRLGSVWYYHYPLDPVHMARQPPLICSDPGEIVEVRWMTMDELQQDAVNCGVAEWIRRQRRKCSHPARYLACSDGG